MLLYARVTLCIAYAAHPRVSNSFATTTFQGQVQYMCAKCISMSDTIISCVHTRQLKFFVLVEYPRNCWGNIIMVYNMSAEILKNFGNNLAYAIKYELYIYIYIQKYLKLKS